MDSKVFPWSGSFEECEFLVMINMKNGVADGSKVEPIYIAFLVKLPPVSRLRIIDPNLPTSKDKLPITKHKLGELIRECIEVNTLWMEFSE